jgi:hypothetical protein
LMGHAPVGLARARSLKANGISTGTVRRSL